MQNNLSHLHRLASIGELTAGICHEIRTPLAAIMAYSEMIVMNDHKLDEGSLEKIGKIHDAAFRMAKIVEGMLNFSKKEKPAFEEIDINQVIGSSITFFRHRGVSLQVAIILDTNGYMPITGNFYQLQQVFFNLIMNSMEALQDKKGERKIFISTHLNYDGNIEVIVMDTGIGIAKAYQEYIFQPFFTTKQSGTGLGLSIVKGIVELHGGKIFIEPNSDEGCFFKLIFPPRHKKKET